VRAGVREDSFTIYSFPIYHLHAEGGKKVSMEEIAKFFVYTKNLAIFAI
jgi:hypothetical protein